MIKNDSENGDRMLRCSNVRALEGGAEGETEAGLAYVALGWRTFANEVQDSSGGCLGAPEQFQNCWVEGSEGHAWWSRVYGVKLASGVCAWRCAGAAVHMWGSEGSLENSVLLLFWLQDGTQISSLAISTFTCHLASPLILKHFNSSE